MKRCSKCGVKKPLGEFYKNKSETCGHHSYCKDCKRHCDKISYENNKYERKKKRAENRNDETRRKERDYNNERRRLSGCLPIKYPDGSIKYVKKRIHYMSDNQFIKARELFVSGRLKEYASYVSKIYSKTDIALKASADFYKNHKDDILNRTREYRLKNKDKYRAYSKKYYFKKKKITHTLKEISSIFVNQTWPYSTKGKDDITKQMREVIGDVNPIQKNSFLSMPNLGRELNLLQDVIRFEDSVGIERDYKLFRSIQRAFAKFFPTMKVEKDCIDNYSINTEKVFDVAHLDYNGFLTESHIKAASKLVNDGTMTFVTLNMHQRFEKMEMFKPLDELTSIGNVVFEKEYFGKRKCPMITLGITA